MTKTTIGLVVLDMAGTTVRDAGQVPQAFTSALAAHGVAVTPQAINSLRGASKRLAILSLLPDDADREARAAQVYTTFVEHLSPCGVGNCVVPRQHSRFTFSVIGKGRVVPQAGIDNGDGNPAAGDSIAVQRVNTDNGVVIKVLMVVVVPGYQLNGAIT